MHALSSYNELSLTNQLVEKRGSILKFDEFHSRFFCTVLLVALYSLSGWAVMTKMVMGMHACAHQKSSFVQTCECHDSFQDPKNGNCISLVRK